MKNNPLLISILIGMYVFGLAWILDLLVDRELSLGFKILMSILMAITAYKSIYDKNKKKG